MIASLVLAASAPAAHAMPPDAQAGGAAADAALERQFWRCDHAATHLRLDAATAQACSEVTERLRLVRFGGDLDAMLAWWRAHKEEQHAALAAARGAPPPRSGSHAGRQ